MTDVACPNNFADLIHSLRTGTARVYWDSVFSPSHAQLQELAEVAKVSTTVGWKLRGMKLGAAGTDMLASAWALNPNARKIEVLHLNRCGIPDAGIIALSGSIKSLPNLDEMMLDGNLFSEVGVRSLARAALDLPKLDTLVLVETDEIPMGAETYECLAKLSMSRPKLTLGLGPQGIALQSMVASNSVRNDAVIAQVLRLQRSIFDNIGKCASATTDASTELVDLSTKEDRRLKALLPTLVERYAAMGGFDFIVQIEDTPSTDRIIQRVPENLPLPDGLTSQVRYLSAAAAWFEDNFRESITTVVNIVNSASDMKTLERYIGDVTIHTDIQCVELVCEDARSCGGTYVLAGVHHDRPYFIQDGKPDGLKMLPPKFLYFYDDRDGANWEGWYVSPALAANEVFLMRPGKRGFPDSNGWCRLFKGPATSVSVKTRAGTRKLLDEELPAQGCRSGSRVENHFGPPKSMARCLDKGKARGIGSLTDLNRASIVAEHPVVLAVTFYVVKSLVESRGGTITRVSNKFKLAPYREPPNVHINIQGKDGWISELQFHLGDVVRLKDMMHKFYELNRCDKSKPESFLMPVFPTSVNSSPSAPAPLPQTGKSRSEPAVSEFGDDPGKPCCVPQ